HQRGALFAITEPCVHPTTLDGAVSNVKAQVVRLSDFESFRRKRLGLWRVGPHYLEDCSIGDGVGHRVKVTRLPPTRYRRNLQLSSALDLPERPQSKREIIHRRDAKVLTEAEPEIAVPFGVKQSERLLQMSACTHEIALEPAAQTVHAIHHGSLASVIVALHKFKRRHL